jgi:hypothetical protein
MQAAAVAVLVLDLVVRLLLAVVLAALTQMVLLVRLILVAVAAAAEKRQGRVKSARLEVAALLLSVP